MSRSPVSRVLASDCGESWAFVDPWQTFEFIRAEVRRIRREWSRPAVTGEPSGERAPEVHVYEARQGLVLIAEPVAEILDLEVERESVAFGLAASPETSGDAAASDAQRWYRVRLPAPVVPERVELLYCGGMLLLRLPRPGAAEGERLH